MDTNKQEWKSRFEKWYTDESWEGAVLDTSTIIFYFDKFIVSPLESSLKEKDKEIERLENLVIYYEAKFNYSERK